MKKRVAALWLLVFCVGMAFILWDAIPAKDNSLSFTDQLKQKLTFKIGIEDEEEAKPLREICKTKKIDYPPMKTRIVIDKSDFKMELYAGKTLLKSYPIALGRDHVNAKRVKGDLCTPEGEYYICDRAKNPKKKDLGARWLRLSYPNAEDARLGLKSGIITRPLADSIINAVKNKETPPQDSKLGGGIGIHGGWPKKLGLTVQNWTAGCVGMHDPDVIELYEAVSIGTPVLVKK
jgi:murein L,D-transpeptidase YafK